MNRHSIKTADVKVDGFIATKYVALTETSAKKFVEYVKRECSSEKIPPIESISHTTSESLYNQVN